MLGALGVVTGDRVQRALSTALAPLQTRDPTGLLAMLPLGAAFRYYSVTGSVPRRTAADYTLQVDGLAATPATYTVAQLQALPQTELVRDFHCVTGWRVLGVPWSGVRLSELLDLAGPTATARAVRIHSFDGTYTESLSLDQAQADDVIVALRMLDADVTHDHGGPVRMYVASMYGYKSTKWLSRIELTEDEVPGYWEHRGYAVDGTIQQ